MTTKTDTEQERADFEAWYQHHHGDRDVYALDEFGEYADKRVQSAFNVWQARAALQSQDREDAEQARKDGFSDGVILALQVMTCHGDYGSTAYCELLRAAGMSEIIERAVAEGMWEISGLDRTSDAVAARAAKGE